MARQVVRDTREPGEVIPLSEVTCERLEADSEDPHSCDFCFDALTETKEKYVQIEGRFLCLDCVDRWQLEPKAVNKSVGLVPRGKYAEGKLDPGLNPGDFQRP